MAGNFQWELTFSESVAYQDGILFWTDTTCFYAKNCRAAYVYYSFTLALHKSKKRKSRKKVIVYYSIKKIYISTQFWNPFFLRISNEQYMYVKDVGDEISWWQLWDVGDGINVPNINLFSDLVCSEWMFRTSVANKIKDHNDFIITVGYTVAIIFVGLGKILDKQVFFIVTKS